MTDLLVKNEENVKMNDSIDRQMAIDALGYCQTYLFDSFDKDKKISLEDAEYAIEQLPSAERKGHWYKNSTLINCSVCKHCSWSVNAYEDLVKTFKYCPNCGARMGVEK